MNRRQRILELEEKLAYTEDQRKLAMSALFALSKKEADSLFLLKQLKELVAPKTLTTDAEQLARYLTLFPVVKHCGNQTCIMAYKIPVEELDKFIPKQEVNV